MSFSTPEAIRGLADCLTRLAEQHEALNATLDEERLALIQLDVAVIHACAERKAALAQAIDQTERSRQATVEALAQELGLTGPAPKLTQILDALPTSSRDTLIPLRDRVRAAVNGARDGQTRNLSLTDRFMGLLDRSLHSVHEALASLPVYTTKGHTAIGRGQGFVVSRTA